MSALTREARDLVEAASDGPWEAHTEPPTDAWPSPSGRVVDADGRVVLGSDYLEDADARLIARAPTLLAEMADRMERLEAVVRCFADVMDTVHISDSPDGEAIEALDATLRLRPQLPYSETAFALRALLGEP